MRLSRVRGVKWWRLQNLLGNVGNWRTAQYLILETLVSNGIASNPADHFTQLVCGSRNRQKTPSSMTSFIALHRLRKTASIRFLSSIIPASSFAFVGRAA